MAQRSPYNDRYKTEQKGKTRRSASSAKPKREVADLTPAKSGAAPAKKKGFFARAQSASRPSTPAVPSSPRMKQLRLVWWVLWVLALAVALGILYLQRAGNLALVPYGWGAWLIAMGGAFYLEFFPIRKERALMMEAAKAAGSGKGGKAAKAAAKSEAAAKSGATAKAPAHDATEPPAPDDRQPSDDGDAS